MPAAWDLDASLSDADLAVALVRSAGALAAQMRAEGLTTDVKTSISDVVTAADRAAEEHVMNTLRVTRPDDGILGEEGAAHTGTSGRTWVIDPVDGTYNFVSGLAYWCSALALQDDDGAVLGAVHQPSSGETWVGGRGLPTTLDGTPLAPLADRPLDECSLATYIHPSTLSDPDVLQSWLAVVAGVATPRLLGSGSMDLSNVATGRVGAWAQHSTPAWDWLPGQALVEAAGGRTAVVEHRGHRWHLAANPQALDELVERLTAS
ncbi:inositol monophosphatase family protein [Aeromicrobium fastidiosum]|uniref:Inositol monophosphatase n=1 Tax=Aeromicrobium fastidiosum TaxID=52699 RepID=A0A641AKV2_9ACTN|nr:inositol monophosphatase [Aeromicrobium fastidiosum]KAA1376003.1 inositol monophosphatase [Aeromicrobium fastidiosum]MBP2392134.1 fructose-1,6-bisphosphatase/inositol monophosphatase family enzyme [Aeromicrobium fastidiosum]